MGTMSKSEKEHNRINDEFDMIQEENRDFDISSHLAKVNQTIREVRENSKFSSSQRTELEQYYKTFREDLSEVASTMKKDGGSNSGGDDGTIVDSKKLNDLISEAMKKKKS